MHVDGTLVDSLLDEEGVDLLALVALKLNDLTEFWVINNVAVACKFLYRESIVLVEM